MLILKRHLSERILIGDAIQLMIVEIGDNFVRIGVKAPRELPVDRPEVREAKQRGIGVREINNGNH